MNLILIEILSGFLLSWAELQGLKRSVNQLLNPTKSKRGWGWFFVFRYVALGLAFWSCLELFKANILPFIVSFILSELILRFQHRSIYV